MQEPGTDGSDFILPVAMTDLQIKVTSAVVSSSFSELLSYFDGTESSKQKYVDKLKKMMADLTTVSNHPYLLLTHMQPNLSGKRAPLAIENMSGKFQALVKLAKRFTDPNQNVAIVCEAGIPTDYVELVLADRALNVIRYSNPPESKLYKKEILKRRGATFHLIPSSLVDLKRAAYAAFDVVILMDNKFDVNNAYGRGLRAQLRDPTHRRAFATVIRLVALNSAQHIQLQPNLTFDEQVATTVVMKKQVGALPPIVKHSYIKDLSNFNSFIANPDQEFPLPFPGWVEPANHKDLETSLYLDDEDQYQVDFASRRRGGRRGTYSAAVMGITQGGRNNGGSADTDDEESGSEDSRMTSVQGNDTALQTTDDEVKFTMPVKRRRIELEDETIELCRSLSVESPLSATLIARYNEMLSKTRLEKDELSSFRHSASHREHELERVKEHMQMLALKVLDLERQKSNAERRAEKLSTRNQKLEDEIRNTKEWWQELSDKLALASDESEKLEVFSENLRQAESETARLKSNLANEKSRFTHLQEMADASSQYADELSKQQKSLIEENERLKSQLNDAPVARECAMLQQLKAKTLEIESLKAELKNLQESARVQISSDRAGPGHRGDRRFGGRGGRGGNRQTTPHLPVST